VLSSLNVAREKAQFKQKSLETVLSFGSSLVGAMFGRKLASRTNVTGAASSMRKMGTAARERGDIGRAEDLLEAAQESLIELEARLEEDVTALEETLDADNLEIEQLTVRPRKSDIAVQPVAVVWAPWIVDASGIAKAAY